MSDGVGLCEKDFELDSCNKQLSLRVGGELSKSETRKNLFYGHWGVTQLNSSQKISDEETILDFQCSNTNLEPHGEKK